MCEKSPTSTEHTAVEREGPSAAPGSELVEYSKGLDFWLCFSAIVASDLCSALELTAVATALPTITRALDGEDDFTWVGSAYALSSTAILPLSGALADILGRKPVMLGALFLFALGSALAGAAQNMNWLIAARSKQLS